MDSTFEQYSTRYADLQMVRTDGVLQVTFQTNGGPLVLSERSHREMPYAFDDIANDADNRVIILTGTGDAWCDASDGSGWADTVGTPRGWDKMYRESRLLYLNLLDIEAPIIAAVNGPATRYACLAMMCDIVLAADDATFQDFGHFANDAVPGDAHQLILPFVLGPNRGKYFLLTGQVLSAQVLHDWGVVNEVLTRAELLPRAWEVARDFAQRSPLTLRYTRATLNYELRRRMRDAVEYGLAVQGLAVIDGRSFQS